MAYATVEDVQSRLTNQLSQAEQSVCSVLLDDVAILIDSYNAEASTDIKNLVSCRAVVRALDNVGLSAVPVGASQGSMSALGYSQSWTMSNGSAGEVYLSKAEKRLLGAGNSIGSYSPTQELVPETEVWS